MKVKIHHFGGRREVNMPESIPVRLIEAWIHDLASILKADAHEAETPTDLLINKGMRHGVAQIGARLTTWRRHQENVQSLSRSGKKFLVTKDIDLSGGRYRKLEWYEGDLFVVLAWRHGAREERGELMLEMEETKDLSKTYLVYEGNLSFDDLRELARKGGLESVKNEENRREWAEKVWS